MADEHKRTSAAMSGTQSMRDRVWGLKEVSVGDLTEFECDGQLTLAAIDPPIIATIIGAGDGWG
jgi:hypothetical protein